MLAASFWFQFSYFSGYNIPHPHLSSLLNITSLHLDRLEWLPCVPLTACLPFLCCPVPTLACPADFPSPLVHTWKPQPVSEILYYELGRLFLFVNHRSCIMIMPPNHLDPLAHSCLLCPLVWGIFSCVLLVSVTKSSFMKFNIAGVGHGHSQGILDFPKVGTRVYSSYS